MTASHQPIVRNAPSVRTTCRLLTPGGAGAIAVVRIAGPQALEVLGAVFKPARSNARLEPNDPERLVLGRVVVDGEFLDDTIATVRRGTDGPPEAEVCTHGGMRVVERLLMALQAAGATVVHPGSSARCSWPARSLLESEILSALCRARTRRAVAFLLYQRAVLPAHVEQKAELALHDPGAARAGLARLAASAEAGRILVEGATVALVGPPNAGKSTLANRLVGAPRMVASARAGTTRDWVDQPAAIRGVPVTVLDTPGIAKTTDALDKLAIERAAPRWAGADVQIVVLDGSTDPPVDFLERAGPLLRPNHLIVVANKSDRPRGWGDDWLPAKWQTTSVALSALHGDGLESLYDRLLAILALANHSPDVPSLFTRRQAEVVAESVGGTEESGGGLADLIRDRLIGNRPDTGRL